MITQDKIDQAIRHLRGEPGGMPSIFVRYDPEVKNGKLLINNLEVVPIERAPEIIAAADRDPATTGGATRIWRHLKTRYFGITSGQVNAYIKSSPLHQVFQPPKTHTTSKSIVPSGPNLQWQIDLIDMSYLDRPEKWGMIVYDLFSKFAHGVALPNKEGKTVAKAMDQLLKRFQPPKIGQTDNGLEFSKEFDKVLAKHGVKHVRSLPYTPTSQGQVERFNKTLKTDMNRLMAQHQTTDWASFLPGLIANHNNSITRTTGLKPVDAADVAGEHADEIKERLQAQTEQVKPDTFAVGDHVRVAIKRTGAFEKGTKQNWSNEVYQISHISKPKTAGARPQYRLGTSKKYWGYQLRKVPAGSAAFEPPPAPPKEEKLDKLDPIDEDFKYEGATPPPLESKRPQRNRTKKIAHGDYYYA